MITCELMTVQEALKGLVENDDRLHEVPEFLARLSHAESGRALMLKEPEDYQQRSNEEWVDLISEEDDSLEAAHLLIDWANDKAQAWEKLEGYEDEARVPEWRRMSR
jgi:hypothetical protein